MESAEQGGHAAVGSLSDDDVSAKEDWLLSDEEADAATREEARRPNDYAMATKDTLKVQGKLYDEGYRAGITTGKEAMIQVGFDEGYNQKGAPVGKQYGHLMGTIYAMEQYSLKQGVVKEREAVTSLKATVLALQLSDMVERDWEALEHEREHGADVSGVQRETTEEKRHREARLGELQVHADVIMRSLLAKEGKQ